MLSVLDTIFQPNKAAVDGSGQTLDIIGICESIELIHFPKETGALCSTFECGQIFRGFLYGNAETASKECVVVSASELNQSTSTIAPTIA